VSFSAAAQELSTRGCGVSQLSHDTVTEARSLGHGITQIPKNMVKPKNLAWELPIAAATGLLITKVDQPADRRIQSLSLERTAGRWSNVGLGMELAAGGIAYAVGCHDGDHYLRDTGFKALAAVGAAGTIDFGLKLAFDRQYPFSTVSQGKF